MKKIMLLTILASIMSFSVNNTNITNTYKKFIKESNHMLVSDKVINYLVNYDNFNLKEKEDIFNSLKKELNSPIPTTLETLGIKEDVLNKIIKDNYNLNVELNILNSLGVNGESKMAYIASYSNLSNLNDEMKLLEYSFRKDPKNILAFLKLASNIDVPTKNVLEVVKLLQTTVKHPEVVDNYLVNSFVRDKEYKSLQNLVSDIKITRRPSFYAYNKATYYLLTNKKKDDKNAEFYLRNAILSYNNEKKYISFYDIKSLVKTYLNNYKNNKDVEKNYKYILNNFGGIYFTNSDGSINQHDRIELENLLK